MEHKELMYWVAFNIVKGIGPKKFFKLLNHFLSAEIAWNASSKELLNAGLDEKTVSLFLQEKKIINPEQELEKIYTRKIGIVTKSDEQYPSILKHIPDAPSLLYYFGTLKSVYDSYAISIVGSRKATPYGQQVTEDITRELTRHSIPVISGLALGIDSIAHKTCVANQARTIAVLAHGLDTIYPSSNRVLAREIVDTGGLLLSEFPLNTPSYKSHFPYRNRVIAGLSLGTLIVEATEKSGSLITANMAMEYNREVFTVPGSIYSPSSKGPHHLLKQGACLVTNASDILSTLSLDNNFEQTSIREIVSDDPVESQIIDLLRVTARSIDEIVKHTTLDVGNINSILVSMELKGIVRNTHGTIYRLAR